MTEPRQPLFLEATQPRRAWPASRLVAFNVIVAVAYMTGAYVGLKLAFVGEVVTLFWPPSGLAFAAVWMGGARLLPGVGVGAFTINLAISGNPILAAVVACGSMAAPLVGASALKAILARHGDAGELRRVLLFILTALGSTMISATAGTTALMATDNLADPSQLPWLIWWLGDAMGVLIIAPPILLWRRPSRDRLRWRVIAEIAALALAATTVLAVPLMLDPPLWASELGALCTLLLCLLAAARFGLNGPAWMVLLIATGTIGVTLLGAGPFQRGDFYDNFALVHSHLFTVALAGMLLAATLADMRRTIIQEKLARKAAEEAAISRVRLLTMISHDVRTPLSGMMTVLQRLDRAVLSPELGRLVGLGLRAGSTLTALVTHILDAARADAGRITLVPAPFNPATSLADIVAFSRPAALAKGIAINLSSTDQLPSLLMGDRVRFEQLVGNLVVNAVAYTSRGEVSIHAGWHQTGAGGTLVVEVADTGSGIDAARIPRIFEGFAMGDHVAPDSGGLGLGLQICRRLTDLMGGMIGYTPEPRGGSRFWVTLPLAVATTEPATSNSWADQALRILLVEDDEIAGETTRALLETAGHEAVLAADIEAALACLAGGAFGLVLLDLRLGGGTSGLDVVRAIRALPGEAARVRLVALTADGLVENHAALKAAGFDGVIVKPLMIGRGLKAAVEAALWPEEYPQAGARKAAPALEA